MAYIPIDTDRFTDWNFLYALTLLCTEVLYAVTNEPV